MINTILNIFLLASFLYAITVILLHQMHMFQLNSYKPEVHKTWLKDNSKKTLSLIIQFTVIFIISALFNRIGMIISIILYVLIGLLNKPAQAKKPLVYTKRVKRMLITAYIILTLLLLLSLVTCNNRLVSSAFIFIASLLYPYLVLLANAVNKPIEKKINDGFINEAKAIIDSMPDLTVIGVTGSYGKTSVKFYLQKLLSAKYNVLVTPENFNTTLGVVITIREHLRSTHEIFVCEMGAKNIGDIKEICDLVKPKHGVITSIGPQHLESFKTIDNVIKTKFELADSIDNNGIVFLNYDNEYIADKDINKNIVTYGINNENAKYRPYDITVSSKGSEFKLRDKDGTEYSFTTKLIGEHNVLNIAGAIAVAHTLNVPMSDLAVQVRRLEGVPHRLQLIKGNNALIIDDAYNSNPSGAKAALDTLGAFEGLKIVVTPGMVELGSKQYECNRIFGTQIADICDYAVLVGKTQTKPILDGLESVNYPSEKTYVADDLKDALAFVEKLDSNSLQKIVLLENDLPDNY